MAKLNRVDMAIRPRYGNERNLETISSIEGDTPSPYEIFYTKDTGKILIYRGYKPYIREGLAEFPDKKRSIMLSMVS